MTYQTLCEVRQCPGDTHYLLGAVPERDLQNCATWPHPRSLSWGEILAPRPRAGCCRPALHHSSSTRGVGLGLLPAICKRPPRGSYSPLLGVSWLGAGKGSRGLFSPGSTHTHDSRRSSDVRHQMRLFIQATHDLFTCCSFLKKIKLHKLHFKT